MTVAIIAALAMLVQDIVGTIQTQAQARDHAILGGLCDVVGWLVAFLSLNISLNAVNGHNTTQKWLVIGLVSLANFVGVFIGTKIGKRYVKVAPPHVRLADHEERLSALEKERAPYRRKRHPNVGVRHEGMD